jgi:hypothetical protein
MVQKTDWPEPRLADQASGGSGQPDTETLLAELGAFYPVVIYPTQEEPEEQFDEVIFAGLVWP